MKQARSGQRYSLDEVLFIIDKVDKDNTVDEVAQATQRSKAGLRAKFSDRVLEDGKTSLRGVKQYKSMEELYRAFGESYPAGDQGPKDIKKRIESFQVLTKSLK